MKKIFILLITTYLLLCTGCADILNDGKTMTLQDCPGAISPAIDDFSMYFLLPRNNTQGDLYWTNGKTYTDNNMYVYFLKKKKGIYKESQSYHVGRSDLQIHSFIYPFSETALPDGVVVVHKEPHTDSELWDCDLSKIITNDEIIRIKAGDPSTWPADSVLTNTGSTWDEQTQTPQPSQTETNNRLWINLNNKAWICLGRTE